MCEGIVKAIIFLVVFLFSTVLIDSFINPGTDQQKPEIVKAKGRVGNDPIDLTVAGRISKHTVIDKVLSLLCGLLVALIVLWIIS